MRRRVTRNGYWGRLAGLALAALMSGCAPALATATASDLAVARERWPGTTLEDLGRGRADYVAKCSGCHTLFQPQAHTAEQWPDVVRSMAARARLTEAEHTDIVRFLVTLAPR